MQAQSVPVVGAGRGGAAALVGRGRGRGRGRGIISALAPGTVAVGRNMQGSAIILIHCFPFVSPVSSAIDNRESLLSILSMVLLIIDCPLLE